MSMRMVAIAVERLLTDKRLRARFRVSRIEALVDLGTRGIELTPDEIELFIQTDARVWLWEDAVTNDRVH